METKISKRKLAFYLIVLSVIAALSIKVIPAMAKAAEWATSGLDIYNTNSGNVGIGTSNPGANLVALYKTAGNADISFGNSLTTFYALGVDHTDSDKFKISGSGALGTGDVFVMHKFTYILDSIGEFNK